MTELSVVRTELAIVRRARIEAAATIEAQRLEIACLQTQLASARAVAEAAMRTTNSTAEAKNSTANIGQMDSSNATATTTTIPEQQRPSAPGSVLNVATRVRLARDLSDLATRELRNGKHKQAVKMYGAALNIGAGGSNSNSSSTTSSGCSSCDDTNPVATAFAGGDPHAVASRAIMQGNCGMALLLAGHHDRAQPYLRATLALAHAVRNVPRAILAASKRLEKKMATTATAAADKVSSSGTTIAVVVLPTTTTANDSDKSMATTATAEPVFDLYLELERARHRIKVQWASLPPVMSAPPAYMFTRWLAATWARHVALTRCLLPMPTATTTTTTTATTATTATITCAANNNVVAKNKNLMANLQSRPTATTKDAIASSTSEQEPITPVRTAIRLVAGLRINQPTPLTNSPTHKRLRARLFQRARARVTAGLFETVATAAVADVTTAAVSSSSAAKPSSVVDMRPIDDLVALVEGIDSSISLNMPKKTRNRGGGRRRNRKRNKSSKS